VNFSHKVKTFHHADFVRRVETAVDLTVDEFVSTTGMHGPRRFIQSPSSVAGDVADATDEIVEFRA
jgi:hypothetical protein